MRANVHVICHDDTALGVALAGIAPHVAANGAEAAGVLGVLAHEPGRGGVVLIEQSLYDALPGVTKRELRREGVPIVMPFPGPSPLAVGVPPEQELLDLLRRAIGYRVRLR